jgi:hypothetical protein
MCLGAHLNHLKGDGPLGMLETSASISCQFREKAAQCLVLSEYTKPKRTTVEALILYFASESIRNPGMPFSLHVVFGIIVRTAMRMGYHRDGSLYSGITCFQAEMRRRIWTWIRMTDILLSSQIGMPKFIAEGIDDTALPLNLLDDDFDEDVIELPSPRSDLESTVISYLVQKSKLVEVLGRIITNVNSRVPLTKNMMVELDEKLQEVHRSLPSWLQIKVRPSFITGAPNLLLRRVAVDMVYHRSRCILHRRSLYMQQDDSYLRYSRSTCVEAAMQILEHQSTLYESAQPGGCLHQERWKMTWHYTNDFLLAAVIIYLELKTVTRGLRDEQIPSLAYRNEDLMRAINESSEIWVKESAISNEAADASHILKLMLDNLGVIFNVTTTVTTTATQPMVEPSADTGMFMCESFLGRQSNFSPFSPSHIKDKLSRELIILALFASIWLIILQSRCIGPIQPLNGSKSPQL